MGALRFVTWNVNGAGSREKKLKIFGQLKKLQADVVLLQETHRPATATDQLKTTEFPNVFSACYNSKQRGVAILIHKNVNFTVLNTVIDPEGRFLIIKLSIFDKKLCIVSIYGPNVDDPSFFDVFFTALFEHLDCALVIGGDLNFGLNKEMDRLSTAGTQRNWESTNIVKQYMSDYGLCDAWRSFHPNRRKYTFFSHVHHSYSRLDYFLVSSSLLSDISDTEINPIAVSDHAAVSLTLVNKKATPPSNNWRFNTSLLKDLKKGRKMAARLDAAAAPGPKDGAFMSFNVVCSSPNSVNLPLTHKEKHIYDRRSLLDIGNAYKHQLSQAATEKLRGLCLLLEPDLETAASPTDATPHKAASQAV